MKKKLAILKNKYHIKPTTFIRQAIYEKLETDIPKLKAKKDKIKIPF